MTKAASSQGVRKGVAELERQRGPLGGGFWTALGSRGDAAEGDFTGRRGTSQL